MIFAISVDLLNKRLKKIPLKKAVLFFLLKTCDDQRLNVSTNVSALIIEQHAGVICQCSVVIKTQQTRLTLHLCAQRGKTIKLQAAVSPQWNASVFVL